MHESHRCDADALAGEELESRSVGFVHRVNVRADAALVWETGIGEGTCTAAIVDRMSWEL